jgi:hypothetical protein
MGGIFPYSLSRSYRQRPSRLKRIEKTVNRTEIKVDNLALEVHGVVECLDKLCDAESPIMNLDGDKVKFKVIL